MIVHMSKVKFLNTNGGMIEEHGDYRLFYVNWEDDFRCAIHWKDQCLEINYLPRWTLLNQQGEFDDRHEFREIPWYEEIEGRNDGEEPQQYMVLGSELDWQTDTKLANDYVSCIPENVRVLSGPFGEAQWLALEAMHQEPEFVDLLRAELQDFGPSALISYWLLQRAFNEPKSRRIEISLEYFTRTRRDALVHAAYMGWAPSKKELDILKRYRCNRPKFANYWHLLRCFRHSDKVDVLSTMSDLSSRLIRWIEEAPAWLCPPNILEVVREQELDLGLHEWVPEIAAYLSTLTTRERDARLARIRTYEDLRLLWIDSEPS